MGACLAIVRGREKLYLEPGTASSSRLEHLGRIDRLDGPSHVTCRGPYSSTVVVAPGDSAARRRLHHRGALDAAEPPGRARCGTRPAGDGFRSTGGGFHGAGALVERVTGVGRGALSQGPDRLGPWRTLDRPRRAHSGDFAAMSEASLDRTPGSDPGPSQPVEPRPSRFCARPSNRVTGRIRRSPTPWPGSISDRIACRRRA